MEQVFYQGVIIEDWLDYIALKFSDTNYFEVIENQKRGDVIINSKTNNTRITFTELTDPKYFLKISFCVKPIYGLNCVDGRDFDFNQQEVNFIDKWFDIPIKTGWLYVEYYVFSSLYKTVSFEGTDKSARSTTIPAFKESCLVQLLLFPIFILLNKLLKHKFIGRQQEYLVEPIIKQK